MKVSLSTGEMASHFGISKQTLIYYDKIGLFRPKIVNPETGYRFYTMEQCEVLDVILSLKRMDMSLGEIRDYLALKSVDQRILVLEAQERATEKKIESIRRIRQRLGLLIRSYRQRRRIVPFEIGIRRMPERPLVSQPIHAPHDMYQFEIAIKRLLETTQSRDDTGLHEFMDTMEVDAKGRELFHKTGLYVPDGGNDRLEAGDYAYIFHKGAYDTIAASRQNLLDYVESMGLRPVGMFVENTLMDTMAVSTEDDYLVEVLLRVRSSETVS